MKLSAFVLALCLSTPLAGCDLLNTPTKTAKGELYQSGDGRYDGWFAQVHQEQLGAASWGDESKSSRKALVSALGLRPGSSNGVIVGAVRDKKGTAALGPTVDQTIASERERAKKLSGAENRLDELARRGATYKKEAIEERDGMGADKADETKVKKRSEVKRELVAAVEVVENLRDDAQHGAAEADELATKLRTVWGGEDAAEKPAAPAASAAPKKPEPPKKPAAKRPPAADPGAAEKPEKPAKPAPPPANEVFNP